jgi:hypothetical protein
VARDNNIKAKFSEKMLKSSINKGTVQLYEGNLTNEDLNPVNPPECDPGPNPDPNPSLPVLAKVNYIAKKKLAVLNPEPRLEPNTQYTAVVEGAGDW